MARPCTIVSDDEGRVGIDGFPGTYRLGVDGLTATVELGRTGDLTAQLA